MRTAKEDAWRRARADRQELHEKGKEISALKDQLRNAAEEARVLSEAKVPLLFSILSHPTLIQHCFSALLLSEVLMKYPSLP